MKRRPVLVVLLLALALAGCGRSVAPAPPPPASASDAAIARAFDARATGVEVQGSGTVERVLSDDVDGSRHQRFIVRLASGQTLLIAHNIDVAPRLSPLSIGDTVEFRGEYAWNEEGGVIHWTHHDPAGQHEAGWLRTRSAVAQ